MPAQFTQDNRLLKLTSPLGVDVLLVESFTISERVSDLFTMEVDALLDVAKKVKPRDLLGEPVTIRVSMDPQSPKARFFNGIISRVSVGGETERFRNIKLEVVPKLWVATLNQNFRVFETKSVMDVIKEILSSYGITPTDRTVGSFSKWDLITQYRETDFHFLSRIMEHEGIFYFFEHSDGKHALVLGNSSQAFQASPTQSSYNYAPEIGPGGTGDYLGEWNSDDELRSGSYRLWDWHLENASRFEAEEVTAQAAGGNSKYKISDFTGQFTQQFNKIDSVSNAPAEGKKLAKVRMQEVETENPSFSAGGMLRGLSCGHKFTVVGGDPAGDYAVISCEHSGMQNPPYIYGGDEAPLTYSTSITCCKYSNVYRPARVHKKPIVQGPQTAIVTERPDKYGRVRVKFPWGNPQGVSAWVRVAQKWAGNTYGAQWIPRPSHEVIIEFLDGDPDQPIIVGCVYSKTNMPPYTLPGNFTQSGVKTRSLDSNGDSSSSDDFNELRFEDKKGSEDIYFHAQKDFHRVVENDDDLKVGHDQTIEIKNNRTEVVKDGNEKVTIEKGNREIYVDKGNDKHQIKMGNRECIIDMGNDSLRIKMGNQTTKLDLGKSETEAMQSIELKVGQSSIKLDQMGVTIKGMMIKIEAQIQMQQKALLYQANGDALVQIKGGITMIN